MATLSIFAEHFTSRLRTSVRDHLDWYQSEDSWVEDFAEGGKWELPTSVEPKLPAKTPMAKLLAAKAGDDHQDLENSIRLHKALQALAPIQARDPRLWARLAHVEFWPYMRRRWPIERYLPDREKAARYVEERYFVPKAEGRALLRNGVARLWWYSHMTYDADRGNNPYELTGVLLRNLDITQQILERSMGRSRVVLVAFLEFLLENPELLESGGDATRAKVRALAKALNVYGGVALLDCLTTGSIKAHLAKELARVQANETAPAAA